MNCEWVQKNLQMIEQKKQVKNHIFFKNDDLFCQTMVFSFVLRFVSEEYLYLLSNQLHVTHGNRRLRNHPSKIQVEFSMFSYCYLEEKPADATVSCF